MNILVGLTTTRKECLGEALEDLRRLGLTSLALFPTALNPRERRDLYRELENSPVQEIPHVHLRSDMDEAEMAYLVERFQTRVFNIHSRHSAHPFPNPPRRYEKRIFVENSGAIPDREELTRFGGLCIDFSHWEHGRRVDSPEYRDFAALAGDFPVGCCHVSAIRDQPTSPWGTYDDHRFETVDQFAYLARYRAYLPDLVSLELENLPSEQLRVREYLVRLLDLPKAVILP